MKRKVKPFSKVEGPEFGRNTAILFVALAIYLVVANSQWAGYLLLFSAAVLWIAETEEEKGTSANQHSLVRS